MSSNSLPAPGPARGAPRRTLSIGRARAFDREAYVVLQGITQGRNVLELLVSIRPGDVQIFNHLSGRGARSRRSASRARAARARLQHFPGVHYSFANFHCHGEHVDEVFHPMAVRCAVISAKSRARAAGSAPRGPRARAEGTRIDATVLLRYSDTRATVAESNRGIGIARTPSSTMILCMVPDSLRAARAGPSRPTGAGRAGGGHALYAFLRHFKPVAAGGNECNHFFPHAGQYIRVGASPHTPEEPCGRLALRADRCGSPRGSPR